MDAVRAIADAVLYEGYVLWPYRRSALKNQRRWTFGGVYPAGHSAGREDDACLMRTACLLEGGDDARVEVRVRFLHVVRRRVAADGQQGRRFVDELAVGDERHLAWEEAVEREVVADALTVAELAAGRRVAIDIPAGEQEQPLREPDGRVAGALVRSWQPLAGAVDVVARPIGDRLWRVTVEISNTTAWGGGPREQALERTFCSTHTVLHAEHGTFVSLTDPPDALRAQAEACRADNAGTWPVLVGEPGERDTLLSSPIILEDHPRIAPESPGDLFDGGEIDQMLVLNILSLTDEEKAEMRDSDPRTREILERTEALGEEQMMSLHGAIRDFRVVRER
jgi:hypothetical protein